MVNLIVKPVWIFAIDLKVQNTVGYTTYGSYMALLSFSLIFQIILDFGLQSYNTRIISRHPGKFQRLFPNMIIAKGILSIGYLIMVMLLGLLTGFRGSHLYLLLLLCFVQVLNSFVLYLRSNISGMQHFKTDSLLSVADKLLMIGICSFLLYNRAFAAHFEISWFVWAQIAAYLVTTVIAFVLCIRFAKLDWAHFDYKRIWHICRGSFPYALLIFLMAVYIRSSPFLTERLSANGPQETGVYAAAFRLLDAGNNMTGVLFAGILLSLFGRLLITRQSLVPIIRTSINLLIPVAVTAAAVAFYFGFEIMKLQHHDATVYDGKVFTILMFTFPAYCSSYVYATLLTANGNIRQLIIISVIGVIISLTLNFILVPRYGAEGAVISDCCTHLTVAILNVFTAKKLLGLRQNMAWLLQLIAFSLAMFIITGVIHHLQLNLLSSLFFIALSAAAAVFLLRLFSFRMLRQMIDSVRK